MVLFGFLCKLLGRLSKFFFISLSNLFQKLAMINLSFEEILSLLKQIFSGQFFQCKKTKLAMAVYYICASIYKIAKIS
jgi:hypothetical protein